MGELNGFAELLIYFGFQFARNVILVVITVILVELVCISMFVVCNFTT